MKGFIKKILPNKTLKIFSYLRNHFIHFFYKGNSVVCSICGATYRRFRPYGVVKRNNAICPNCNSLERHRLLWKYIFEYKKIFNNTAEQSKVLHFGPEHFFYRFFDNVSHIDYVPCDLFPEKYKYNGQTKLQKIDITQIPYEDDSFDFVLCNHVLEHIPEDNKAIAELYRVMKNGAWGVFQVPIDIKRDKTFEDFRVTSFEEREIKFGQYDHVRIYGKDYKDRLKKAGFKVVIDDYVKSFSKSELIKYGFSESELIYCCYK